MTNIITHDVCLSINNVGGGGGGGVGEAAGGGGEGQGGGGRSPNETTTNETMNTLLFSFILQI